MIESTVLQNVIWKYPCCNILACIDLFICTTSVVFLLALYNKFNVFYLNFNTFETKQRD